MTTRSLHDRFVAILLAAFCLNLFVFLNASQIIEAPPLTWVALLLFLAVPHMARLGYLLSSPLCRLSFGLLFLAALSVLRLGPGPISEQGINDRILSMLFAASCVALLSSRGIRHEFERLLPLVFAIGLGMNLYEVLQPMTWSQSFGRSSGFYLNPNISGLAISAICLALILGPRTPRARTTYLILATIAIMTTYSRGGILVWALISMWVVWQAIRHQGGRGMAWPLAILGTLLFLPLILAQYSSSFGDVINRVNFLTAASIESGMRDPRLDLVKLSLEVIREHLLLGHGPGRATLLTLDNKLLGAHNQYLAVTMESGLFGLTLMLVFFRNMWRNGPRLVVFFLLLESLFFHSLFQLRPLLVVLALVEARRLHAAEDARLGITPDAIESDTLPRPWPLTPTP